MSKILDKFGREIKVGDVVTNGNKGEANIYIVRGFTNDRLRVDRVVYAPEFFKDENGNYVKEMTSYQNWRGETIEYERHVMTPEKFSYSRGTTWAGYKIIVTGLTEQELKNNLGWKDE